MPTLRLLATIFVLLIPGVITAQQFEVAFGSLRQDTEQPVEVTADKLSLNQSDGTALFEGNVLIIQGAMRITAPKVVVQYNADASGIEKLFASGRVLMVKEKDAIEADTADYNIANGTVEMVGDVLLSQGANTLSSNKMNVDLKTGTAQLEGRVKTILRSGNN